MRRATDEQLMGARLTLSSRQLDQAGFAEVARTDPDWVVRVVAVPRLTDEGVLMAIIRTSEDAAVREAALRNEYLTDQDVLADRARNDEDEDARIAAITKLNNRAILAKIATEDKDDEIRKVARRRLRFVVHPRLMAWLIAFQLGGLVGLTLLLVIAPAIFVGYRRGLWWGLLTGIGLPVGLIIVGITVYGISSWIRERPRRLMRAQEHREARVRLRAVEKTGVPYCRHCGKSPAYAYAVQIPNRVRAIVLPACSVWGAKKVVEIWAARELPTLSTSEHFAIFGPLGMPSPLSMVYCVWCGESMGLSEKTCKQCHGRNDEETVETLAKRAAPGKTDV